MLDLKGELIFCSSYVCIRGINFYDTKIEAFLRYIMNYFSRYINYFSFFSR